MPQKTSTKLVFTVKIGSEIPLFSEVTPDLIYF